MGQGFAKSQEHGEVAIIGMACLFPGAPDLHTYWQNIIGKVSAIGEPPPGWADDEIFAPHSQDPTHIYTRKGGFLGDLARFNPTAYGVMPQSVEGANPEHFLALRIAHEVLADAGYLTRPFNREKAGVILGHSTFVDRGNVTALQHGLVINQTLRVLKQLHPEYRDEELRTLKQRLTASLPPFNAETAPGLVSNVMCGRIANRLDLRGPNYAVDAACASSMIALDLGMRELVSGRCDLMLTGGVSLLTPPIVFMVFCQLGALSRSGQIRPFDREADGTLLGEGIGMVALKRLADARRDGDRVYAVIRGVGTASDGRALAVLAPRLEGEELALRRAYEAAGLSPRTIGLIEAHGTGTTVGDQTEIQALRRVFGDREGVYPHCALGSVKSMISHTIPAAGVAGLIKAALALYHKTLPPTLNCETPNPKFELEKTSFYINTEPRPWIHGGQEPRRAGVNAFGFGGINTHVILEEAPGTNEEVPVSYHGDWDSEVVILQGMSRAEILSQGESLQQYLTDTPNTRLRDIAYTFNSQLRDGTLRLSIVASSTTELEQKLVYALQRLSDPQRQRIKDVSGIYFFAEPLAREGQLAFLFPGEGAQYVNMLADLCTHFPEVRACFDHADRVFFDNGRDFVPSHILFPPPLAEKEDEATLWQVDCAVASVFAANQAFTTLLTVLHIKPDKVVGHSSGELAALLTAGAVEISSQEELLQYGLSLNTLYAAIEDRIPAAVLVAVGAVRPGVLEAVQQQVNGPLHITMDNCPHQVILCGNEESAAAAIAALRSRGAICTVLPFKRGYHTPLFEPVSAELDRFFQHLRIATPRTPLYSCATAQPFPTEVDAIRRLAVAQWSQPVRFRETIEAMYAAGVRIFVEVGPKGNLSGFVDDILRGKPYVSVPMNVPHRSGTAQLHHALGLLAAHGVSLQLDYLYARRLVQRLTLDRTAEKADAKKLPMRMALELPTIHFINGEPSPAARETTASPVPSPPSSQPMASAPEQLSLQPGVVNLQPLNFAPPLPSATPVGGLPVVPPAGLPDERDIRAQVMGDYLRTMEQFLTVQEEVLHTFLAGGVPTSSLEETEQPAPLLSQNGKNLPSFAPHSLTLPQAPVTVLPTPPTAPSVAPSVLPVEQSLVVASAKRHEDFAAQFLALVSEKTGYPPEMLDLSLNMEADLGIDSIKRIEILGAFQQASGLIQTEDMEHAASLKTLQEVIAYFGQYVSPGPTSAAPSPEPTMAEQPVHTLPISAEAQGQRAPFVREILSMRDGDEAVVACTLDVHHDFFLRHHTIGGQPSVIDDSLLALPVVPLTVSLEIMGEVAALLVPDKLLIGMKDVQASRWFDLADDRRTVVVRAQRKRAERSIEIAVQIVKSEESASRCEPGPLLIQGTMVFGDQYPAVPQPPAFVLREERPYGYEPQQFYKEVMFHGPLFQSVLSIDRCGEEGARATIRSGTETGFFRSLPRSGSLTDPVLLDAAGQLVGFWTADRLERGFVVFPIGFEALHLYGSLLNLTDRMACQARSRLLNDGRVQSDIDVIDARGRTVAQFLNWEDMRFDFPRTLVRFVLSPQETMLSEPWPEAADRFPVTGASCCRLRLSSLLDASNANWWPVWARIILNRQEQEQWRRLQAPEKRHAEWLLGRLVGKDAVRQFVAHRYGLRLCPADITIATDTHGALVVQGPWTTHIGGAPLLSLAHSGDVAVALAAERTSSTGIGIDIETVRDLPEELLRAAFRPTERALLTQLEPTPAQEWAMRLWCAKEAVGKALGCGLVGGPLNAIVQAYDDATGVVHLTVTGELARTLALTSDTVFTASTRRDGDVIVACAADAAQI